MLVCHEHDVYEYSISSVYVGGCCGLNRLCVFSKLCPIVSFVVCECLSVFMQSIIMSYVDCGDDG